MDEDIKTLRQLGALPIEQAAALVGVTVRHFRRWERGQAPVPVAARRLLRLVCLGDLGEMRQDWRGWTLTADGLQPPGTRVFIRPGEVAAIPYHYALLADLRRQLSKPDARPAYSNVVPIRRPRH